MIVDTGLDYLMGTEKELDITRQLTGASGRVGEPEGGGEHRSDEWENGRVGDRRISDCGVRIAEWPERRDS